MAGMYFRVSANMNPRKSRRKRPDAMGFSSTKVDPALMASNVVKASKKFRAMKTESRIRSFLFTLGRSKDIRNLVSRNLASANLSFILALDFSNKPDHFLGLLLKKLSAARVKRRLLLCPASRRNFP